MELATTKKVWVSPKMLPNREKPRLGYLLIPLLGCSGNTGLYGTIGGRGGCCPLTASSPYCELKTLFAASSLQQPHSSDLLMTKELISSTVLSKYAMTEFEVQTMIRKLKETAGSTGQKLDEFAVSENDYLRFMGRLSLKGLPRKSYVREPWERTKKSTHLSEMLQSCISYHGAHSCIGGEPRDPLTVDVDKDEEESKYHPHCVISTGDQLVPHDQPLSCLRAGIDGMGMVTPCDAYESVLPGKVACSNDTYFPRWISYKGMGLRCRCFPPPYFKLDQELYPGCPASANECPTPPDWSQYS